MRCCCQLALCWVVRPPWLVSSIAKTVFGCALCSPEPAPHARSLLQHSVNSVPALFFPPLLQVNMDVECSFVRDVLRGDDVYEMRLKLLSSSTEAYPFKDDD